MKTSPVPFLRSVLLAAACVFVLPADSRAENPLKNIGGKIKSSVTNVSSAIKNTAKAAKNIVTPGKAAPQKAPPPRATVVASPKNRSAADTPASAKPKRPAAKPAASTPKPRPKNTDSSPPAKAKPKKKAPTPDNDRDSDKPKTRKKSASGDDASDKPKRTDSPDADTPPEKEPSAAPGAVTETTGDGEAGTPPAEPKTREDLPFGTPAFGRKGFVYSPYAPDQGLIDVNNVAAGTKVRCPYTGKVFRVP